LCGSSQSEVVREQPLTLFPTPSSPEPELEAHLSREPFAQLHIGGLTSRRSGSHTSSSLLWDQSEGSATDLRIAPGSSAGGHLRTHNDIAEEEGEESGESSAMDDGARTWSSGGRGKLRERIASAHDEEILDTEGVRHFDEDEEGGAEEMGEAFSDEHEQDSRQQRQRSAHSEDPAASEAGQGEREDQDEERHADGSSEDSEQGSVTNRHATGFRGKGNGDEESTSVGSPRPLAGSIPADPLLIRRPWRVGSTGSSHDDRHSSTSPETPVSSLARSIPSSLMRLDSAGSRSFPADSSFSMEIVGRPATVTRCVGVCSHDECNRPTVGGDTDSLDSLSISSTAHREGNRWILSRNESLASDPASRRGSLPSIQSSSPRLSPLTASVTVLPFNGIPLSGFGRRPFPGEKRSTPAHTPLLHVEAPPVFSSTGSREDSEGEKGEGKEERAEEEEEEEEDHLGNMSSSSLLHPLPIRSHSAQSGQSGDTLAASPHTLSGQQGGLNTSTSSFARVMSDPHYDELHMMRSESPGGSHVGGLSVSAAYHGSGSEDLRRALLDGSYDHHPYAMEEGISLEESASEEAFQKLLASFKLDEYDV
jgi:hypothetical protein